MDTRRRVERIHLTEPLAADLSGQRVFIVDASVSGLRIAHQQPIASESLCDVEFNWEGDLSVARCRHIRTQMQRVGRASYSRSLYHSGLQFVAEPPAPLRNMIEWHVARALDEQKANARGVPPMAAQSTQTGAGTDFVRFELIGGLWRRLPTNDPKQPKNGFTVSIEHSDKEVKLLRQTFEQGDDSARELLRRMAEMSVSNPDGIPTRRYTP